MSTRDNSRRINAKINCAKVYIEKKGSLMWKAEGGGGLTISIVESSGQMTLNIIYKGVILGN